jgi:hypothetical protein
LLSVLLIKSVDLGEMNNEDPAFTRSRCR